MNHKLVYNAKIWGYVQNQRLVYLNDVVCEQRVTSITITTYVTIISDSTTNYVIADATILALFTIIIIIIIIIIIVIIIVISLFEFG